MAPHTDYTEEIDRLVARAAKDPRTHTFARLADLYRKTGELDRALDVVETGLRHHPHYLNARLVHARVLRELGRTADARRAFERVLQVDSENLVARAALAELGARRPAVGLPRPDPAHSAGWLARLDADWRQTNDTEGSPAATNGSTAPEPPPDGPEDPTLDPDSVARGTPAVAGSADSAEPEGTAHEPSDAIEREPEAPGPETDRESDPATEIEVRSPSASERHAEAEIPGREGAEPAPDAPGDQDAGAAESGGQDAGSADQAAGYADQAAGYADQATGSADQGGGSADPGGGAADRVSESADRPEVETATLAALYVRQGLLDRAISIYERLLARDPYNARLATALEEARRQAHGDEPQRAPAQPRSAIPAPESPPREATPDPGVGDPAPAARPDGRPIRELLGLLLDGEAEVAEREGGSRWPAWLRELGRGGD